MLRKICKVRDLLPSRLQLEKEWSGVLPTPPSRGVAPFRGLRPLHSDEILEYIYIATCVHSTLCIAYLCVKEDMATGKEMKLCSRHSVEKKVQGRGRLAVTSKTQAMECKWKVWLLMARDKPFSQDWNRAGPALTAVI